MGATEFCRLYVVEKDLKVLVHQMRMLKAMCFAVQNSSHPPAETLIFFLSGMMMPFGVEQQNIYIVCTVKLLKIENQ